MLSAYFDFKANTVEEVVVTGSFIQGTPKDTAIPVAVLNQEDLEKRGSPSILDIIKTLPISGPVLGDSNQFSTASQGRNGGGTINIRGLGAQAVRLGAVEIVGVHDRERRAHQVAHRQHGALAEQVGELARDIHLLQDVAATHELALDVELGDRRPLAELLDAFAQLLIDQDVDAVEFDTELAQRVDGGGSFSWTIRKT